MLLSFTVNPGAGCWVHSSQDILHRTSCSTPRTPRDPVLSGTPRKAHFTPSPSKEGHCRATGKDPDSHRGVWVSQSPLLSLSIFLLLFRELDEILRAGGLNFD